MRTPTVQEIVDALAGGLDDDASLIEFGALQKALDGQDIHFTSKSRRRNKDLHIDMRRHQNTTLLRMATSVKLIIDVSAHLLDLKKEFAASTIVLIDILGPTMSYEDVVGLEKWRTMHESNRSLD